MKAVLQFKDYHVVESVYKFEPFPECNEGDLSPPRLLFKLSIDQDNIKKAIIDLGIEFGDINITNIPIYVKARITGVFVIEELENNISEDEIIALYKINGIAILFPYLRSLVSDMTSKGSEPPIILPTMNIAKMISDLDSE